MEITDKTLLALFHLGWNDEMDGKIDEHKFSSDLEESAYYTGRSQALIESELQNMELLDEEEVLKMIKDLVN